MGKTTDGETSRKNETKETDTDTRKSQRLRLKPVLQGHTKTIKEKKNLKNRNKNLKSLQVYLKDKKKEKKTVSNIDMIEKKANCDTTTKSNKGDVKIKYDTTCKICHLNLKTEHKFHYHMKTQHRETSQNRKKELKSIQGSLKYKKIEKKPVKKANNYTTRAIMKDVKIKSEVEIKTQNDNLDERSLDSTKSVKCKLCQKGYKNQSGLTQHMRFTHKTYCIHCEENLSSVDELKEHLNKTHNIFAFEDGSLKYGCKICGKTFANGHKLKAHQYVHDIHPPLKCKICHQTLKTENTLSYHMKTKHDETYQKNVSCEYCGKLFWCKSELDKHLRVHTNERPYLCHICSSSFKTTGNLRNHQRAIHENHFWICDVCGQKFKSKPRFQEHLYKEKHGKDGKPIQYKEFPCNECSKIFPRKIDFQIHFRIHSGAKPYKCLECGRAFRCHNHLTQHKVTHTGEKPFKCKFCGKGFSQYANVNCHMKKQCKFKGQENKNHSPKQDSTQVFDHSLMLNESSIRLVAPPGVNKIKKEKKRKPKEPIKPENTSWKVKHVSADNEGPEKIYINHKGTQSDFSIKTENKEEVKPDKVVDFLVDNIVEDMLNDVRNNAEKKDDGSHEGGEEVINVVSAVKNVSSQDGSGGLVNVVDTCKDVMESDHTTNKHASQDDSCGIVNILKDASQNGGCAVVDINEDGSVNGGCGVVDINKDASQNGGCAVVDINKDGNVNGGCGIVNNVDKEIQQLPADIDGEILQPVVFTAEPHVSEVSNSEDKPNLTLTDNRQIMILRSDDMQESKVVLAEITENGMMRYIPVPITDQDGATMFILDSANTEHHSKTYHSQYETLIGNAERETIHIHSQQGLGTASIPHGVETRPQGQQTAGVQQVLESAGEQSASIQHCFENTTNVEKIDQEGFEQQEVTYSTIYSLSEMKSVDNDI
ncbi:uncharacterized protein LOC127732187 [Mytilus californianus]|uniref:uncharacterized protein LOC127732187 n=1 Tax=Mytilus californianus TaxID=6549 RepID=UPI002245349C|nr:uncharacterized protein LOC127732187 [Mytilus californianus]XP_052097216.1 uncharacterized protein LOC127732187 [Mytilus californianus]